MRDRNQDTNSDQNDSNQLADLARECPNGLFLHYNDKQWTLAVTNQGFLDLTGYTREELKIRFNNGFLPILYPKDRAPVMRSVRRQLLKGNHLELVYRILRKDNRAIWVLENGKQGEDGNVIYGSIVEVTDLYKTKEQYRISLRRHEIIMDQVADIIFEWDIQKDKLSFSTNWVKKFGYKPVRERVMENVDFSTYIHREDDRNFFQLLRDILLGKPYATAELRLRNMRGHYIWCRVRVTVLFDTQSQPVKAVGVITDIDADRHMLEDLRNKAQRDALTGFYDKTAIPLLINTYLSNCPKQEVNALLMLDIDNFKLINDTQGHLFGDAVLSEFAVTLKKEVRESDLLGRIGGDEFAVFLKMIPDGECALQKAGQLLKRISELDFGIDQPAAISCSIGIALSPDHGKSFIDLYQCADTALYQAKNLGKNQCVLFSAKHAGLPSGDGSFLGTQIDSNSQLPGTPNLIMDYVFNTLYETEHLDQAIPLILEMIGKQFDVSRAYIFEDANGEGANRLFEWCDAGIAPFKDRLCDMTLDFLNAYYLNFDEQGIFYCRDVQTLPDDNLKAILEPDVTSLLQCAIREGGRICGFIGFDESGGKRFWLQEEIATLSMLSKMLCTFLLQKRAQEKEQKNSRRMRDMLDCQDAFIYAIDQDTYQLLYINKKTRTLDPSLKLGMCCYRAFFGKDAPCEPCPVFMQNVDGALPMEYYNEKYDVWTEAIASPLVWESQSVYLVSCYDITKYKKSS